MKLEERTFGTPCRAEGDIFLKLLEKKKRLISKVKFAKKNALT